MADDNSRDSPRLTALPLLAREFASSCRLDRLGCSRSADESIAIATDLRGHASVQLLLTDVISHAEPDQPADLGDALRLAAFQVDLLS